MATKRQQGTLSNGSYGYPVIVLLSELPDPVITLAGVTQIALLLTRPDATTVSRNLTLPAAIIVGATGVSDSVTWTVLTGEHTTSGTYRFTLTIDSGASQRLITTGSYLVS